MGTKPSAEQMLHIVSLEYVSAHIDTAGVKDLLCQYGEM